jgi:hypothetical protein
MSSLLPITSPQFRVRLIRKLANLVPECIVEFEVSDRPGVAFRLKDKRGRYRSNLVHFHRNFPRLLEASQLVQAIRGMGIPPAGFPEELSRRWTP